MHLFYLSGSSIPSRSANAVHVMKMAQAFVENGVRVTLFARSGSNEASLSDYQYFGVREDFEIVKRRWPPIRGLGGVIFARSVAASVRLRPRPDMIYGRHATSLAAIMNLGISLRFEAHAPPEDMFKRAMFARLFASPYFDKLIVISDALKRYYLETFRTLHESGVIVAHDGADSIGLTTATLKLVDLGERRRVGYVGHLYPGKGMEIIDQLSVRMPDVGFHVVGGTDEDVARWRARAAGRPNLHFYGHVPHSDVQGIVQQFDVVLAPYQRRVKVHGGRGDVANWMSPLKLFEYMAHGKPIIVSDLPVLREIVEHRRNALLCDPEDIGQWIEAVTELLNTPALAHELGSRAKRDFLERHTWKQRAVRVLS